MYLLGVPMSTLLERVKLREMIRMTSDPAESAVQTFLDFLGFDFRDFQLYNSIQFSSPLVILSNLDLRGFCFRGFLFVSPY